MLKLIVVGVIGVLLHGQVRSYKDRAEYDLYSRITHTEELETRLNLLNTWQAKYPDSDFAKDRLQYFVRTPGRLAKNDSILRQQFIDKCNDLLQMDPKYYEASYDIAVWAPASDRKAASPEALSRTESAVHVLIDGADEAFVASKKPPDMSDSAWLKAKNQVVAIGYNALAWATGRNVGSPAPIQQTSAQQAENTWLLSSEIDEMTSKTEYTFHVNAAASSQAKGEFRLLFVDQAWRGTTIVLDQPVQSRPLAGAISTS